MKNKLLSTVFVIVLMFAMTVCVLGAQASDGTEYTPIDFIGFDDGTVPADLVKNGNMALPEGETSFVTSDGIYHGVSTTSDPYFTYKKEFMYGTYSDIKIRMKFNTTDTAATKCNFQVFFAGELANGESFGYSQTYSVLNSIGLNSADEYKIYSLPLDSLEALEGAKITSIRIDFISTIGEYFIDYIMLSPKNDNADIVYNFNDGISPWEASLASRITVSAGDGVLNAVTAHNGGAIVNTSHKYLGADYPTAYVRMKMKGLTKDRYSLFYTNLVDEDGNEVKSTYSAAADGYNYARATALLADEGNYVNYTYDFSGFTSYLNNYITTISINLAQQENLNIDVDAVVLKNKNSLEWGFECDGLNEGWVFSDNCFSIEDGSLKYTENDETYSDPRVVLSGLDVNADNYVGVEVIMKHELINEDDTAFNLQVFFGGTDADGNAFSINSADTKTLGVTTNSSGESFCHYFIDLTGCDNWYGSKINTLRFDPMSALGNCEIEYLRLVPCYETTPLDASLMSLKYTFENDEKGSADGHFAINFGEQNYDDAKNIILLWASGNDTDGYTALEDYTSLLSGDGYYFRNGFTLSKNLLIPDDATALIARIRDCEKTFELVYKIPEAKLPEDYGTPLYTAVFASDFHLGGWGSNPDPNERHAAAREDILASDAQFAVISGDICQWYGEIEESGEWAFATSYFEEFDIPVYMVKGNHDEPNFKSSHVMGIESAGENYVEGEFQLFSYEFFDDFLDNWIDYSRTNGFYDVERAGEDLDYYHNEINGHHYIFLSVPDSGYYAFGDEQLKWFEKVLYESEESGKPIFVFGHVPANGKVNYQIALEKGSIEDFDKFEAIINKHPTAIYTSGDSHYTLNSILPNCVDGKQEQPSYINDGAVIEAVVLPDEKAGGSSITKVPGYNSYGLYVEVYEDKMIVRARDYMNHKNCSLGLSKVTFKEECTLEEISVTKRKTNDGYTLTANQVQDVTYTWIVDGEESTVTTNSITVAEDFDGYVAVRITAQDGRFRSELYDSLSEITPDNGEITGVSFNEDNTKITVSFDSNYEAYENAKLVIAYYGENNVMSGLSIDTIESTDVTNAYKTVDVKDGSAGYVKVFIFETTASLSPICPMVQQSIPVLEA